MTDPGLLTAPAPVSDIVDRVAWLATIGHPTNLIELLELLDALSPEERRRLEDWYRDTGWKLARGRSQEEIAFKDGRRACALALAVVLSSTPRDAMQRCDWRRWFVPCPAEFLPRIVDLLAARGEAWCAQFIDLAAQQSLPKPSFGPVVAAAEIAALSMPLVGRFGLPIPGGEQYARGWAQILRDCFVRHCGQTTELLWYVPIVLEPGKRARPAPEVLDGIRPFLAVTPRPGDTLLAVLRVQDLLGLLGLAHTDPESGDFVPHPNWPLGRVVEELAESGEMNWDGAFVQLLDSMARNTGQNALLAALRILDGLDLGVDRVRPHLPAIASVLPIVPGRATAALLRLALGPEPAGDDLLDLGTTILDRREKAQKATLLAYLAARREPDPAVDELLRLATSSDDAVFAKKAAAVVARRAKTVSSTASGAVPPPAVAVATTEQQPDVAWQLRPVPHRAPAFRPLDLSVDGLVTWLQEASHAPSIATVSRLLDAVVRFGAQDLDGLRRAVLTLPPAGKHPDLAAYVPLRLWVSPQNVVADWPLGDPRPGGWQRPEYALVQEVIRGLGVTRWLLSTPTREDGVLEWNDLLNRLRGLGSSGEPVRFGEWDVLQALLRLELPAADGLAERLAELEALRGIAVVGRYDLAAAVADWVRAGGLPARVVHPQTFRLVYHQWTNGETEEQSLHRLREGREWPDPSTPWVVHIWSGPEQDVRWLSAPPHPMEEPAAAIAGWAGDKMTETVRWLGVLLPTPGAEFPAASQHASFLSVAPFWIELLVAVDRDDAPPSSVLQVWRQSAGPLGLAVHHRLARLLTAPDVATRMEAADCVAELARQGRLDPELLTRGCLDLLAHGQFLLARAAASFEQAIVAGAGAAVWPSLSAVLDEACTASGPKRAGLADLLRTGGRYARTAARHLGAASVPPGVWALASAKGSSKAVAEARVFCAAADTAVA